MSALPIPYDGRDLGRTTIVCSWIFTALAGVAVWAQFVKARRFMQTDDFLIFGAFVIALVLVAQTTWAILDEGQGEHVIDESQTHLALIARVYC